MRFLNMAHNVALCRLQRLVWAALVGWILLSAAGNVGAAAQLRRKKRVDEPAKPSVAVAAQVLRHRRRAEEEEQSTSSAELPASVSPAESVSTPAESASTSPLFTRGTWSQAVSMPSGALSTPFVATRGSRELESTSGQLQQSTSTPRFATLSVGRGTAVASSSTSGGFPAGSASVPALPFTSGSAPSPSPLFTATALGSTPATTLWADPGSDFSMATNTDDDHAGIYGGIFGCLAVGLVIGLAVWCHYRCAEKGKVFNEKAAKQNRDPSHQAGRKSTGTTNELMPWVEPERLDWAHKEQIGIGSAGAVSRCILDANVPVAIKEIFHTHGIHAHIDSGTHARGRGGKAGKAGVQRPLGWPRFVSLSSQRAAKGPSGNNASLNKARQGTQQVPRQIDTLTNSKNSSRKDADNSPPSRFKESAPRAFGSSRSRSGDALYELGADEAADAETLLREVAFLLSVSHPRVIQVLGLTRQPPPTHGRGTSATDVALATELNDETHDALDVSRNSRRLDLPQLDLWDASLPGLPGQRNLFVVMELLEGGSLASALYGSTTDGYYSSNSSASGVECDLNGKPRHAGIPEPGNHGATVAIGHSDSSHVPSSGFRDNALVSLDLAGDSYLDVAHQIATGMEYLHAVGIVHLDLKPENILLRVRRRTTAPRSGGRAKESVLESAECVANAATETAAPAAHRQASDPQGGHPKPRAVSRWVVDVKICDFGLSVLLRNHPGRSTVRAEAMGGAAFVSGGTPAYMPPEAVSLDPFSSPDPRIYARPPYDVYSFGVLLWTLKTASKPYDDVAPRNLLQRVAKHPGGLRPTPTLARAAWRNREQGSCFAAMIPACWNHEAAARPSFAKIVEHLDKLKSPAPAPTAERYPASDRSQETQADLASVPGSRHVRKSSGGSTDSAGSAVSAKGKRRGKKTLAVHAKCTDFAKPRSSSGDDTDKGVHSQHGPKSLRGSRSSNSSRESRCSNSSTMTLPANGAQANL